MTDTPDSTAITPAAEQKAIYFVPGQRGARGVGAQVEVRIASETVWLEQAQIARLFGVTREIIKPRGSAPAFPPSLLARADELIE